MVLAVRAASTRLPLAPRSGCADVQRRQRDGRGLMRAGGAVDDPRLGLLSDGAPEQRDRVG